MTKLSDSYPLATTASIRASARLVRRVLAAAGDPPLRVVLWDGTVIDTRGAEAAVATVHIKDRATLVRIALDAEFQLGDCYARGDVEIDGDLVALLETINRAMPQTGSARAEFVDRVRRLRRLVGSSVRSADIEHHYDRGNAFYAMWLDPTMTYTCAYFEHEGDDLTAAQHAKLDYVCRKLRLRAGERVVEAGAGWGSLALHMAAHYDVEVDAYNISPEQVAYARAQAAERGLSDRVRFIEADYRAISGRFDAFVSIGMLEHVGRDSYRQQAQTIDGCLAPNGRGLIHSIGRHKHLPPSRWMQRRVFPEGYVPSLREMMDVFEPADLVVEDVENLRPHYARTLEHWLTRYEAAYPEVERSLGSRFARTWRLYLASSLASFRAGWHQLYQLLFARAGHDSLPSTRGDLYPGR